MPQFISRRGIVRASSYTLALVLVLAGFAWRGHAAALDYKNQLEATYMRSLGELSSYLTNISTDLDKGRFVGTPAQLSLLSARIWRESGGAKSALSALPVSGLHMDDTYKLLSQVGDYAMTLSKKVAGGDALTADEQANAEALRQYAGKLREYIDGVQQQIRDGSVDVAALRTRQGEGTGGTGQAVNGLENSFEDVEQTMTGYPTLIYDGPFSDHLLTRRPRLTVGMPAVTPEEARERAVRAARVNPEDLKRGDDENSNMPCYVFEGNGISAGITKAGGLPAYLINARDVGEQRLSRAAAFEAAARYLTGLGIEGMRATYFETADGICTVNYAAAEGGVTLYTDLIKVGVALDDGGVVFYDARGYIVNHRERALPEPALTAAEAAKSVSPALTVQSSRLALIPTGGLSEVLTYEFRAKSQDGQELLVYVNAADGAEEQILILIETPEGTLTK